MKKPEGKTNIESGHSQSPISNGNKKDTFFGDFSQTHSPFFGSDTIQPKLKIGQPNDKYEQEANQVADAVLRMPDPAVQRQSIQEEEELQMKSDSNGVGSGFASSEVSSRLKSKKGSGNRLPAGVQSEMSGKIGADFSGVNIHTDSEAVEMNQELGARAFTHRSDIFFNKGEYNPSSSSGKHLLAHELTHVVQQSNQTRFLQKQDNTEGESDNSGPDIGRWFRIIPEIRRGNHSFSLDVRPRNREEVSELNEGDVQVLTRSRRTDLSGLVRRQRPNLNQLNQFTIRLIEADSPQLDLGSNFRISGDVRAFQAHLRGLNLNTDSSNRAEFSLLEFGAELTYIVAPNNRNDGILETLGIDVNPAASIEIRGRYTYRFSRVETSAFRRLSQSLNRLEDTARDYDRVTEEVGDARRRIERAERLRENADSAFDRRMRQLQQTGNSSQTDRRLRQQLIDEMREDLEYRSHLNDRIQISRAEYNNSLSRQRALERTMRELDGEIDEIASGFRTGIGRKLARRISQSSLMRLGRRILLKITPFLNVGSFLMDAWETAVFAYGLATGGVGFGFMEDGAEDLVENPAESLEEGNVDADDIPSEETNTNGEAEAESEDDVGTASQGEAQVRPTQQQGQEDVGEGSTEIDNEHENQEEETELNEIDLSGIIDTANTALRNRVIDFIEQNTHRAPYFSTNEEIGLNIGRNHTRYGYLIVIQDGQPLAGPVRITIQRIRPIIQDDRRVGSLVTRISYPPFTAFTQSGERIEVPGDNIQINQYFRNSS